MDEGLVQVEQQGLFVAFMVGLGKSDLIIFDPFSGRLLKEFEDVDGTADVLDSQ